MAKYSKKAGEQVKETMHKMKDGKLKIASYPIAESSDVRVRKSPWI